MNKTTDTKNTKVTKTTKVTTICLEELERCLEELERRADSEAEWSVMRAAA